ncbi:hypothetical protein AVEN_147751-1 [Araneus ventricosus]|uniref:Uncharacterized protein n=1 Tax=Araneus ventricosus TaxID=182803 RepID=A0A4Y2U2I9_ARAVE|nr:hypothetical protein AVEN_147751-1 [Araneus ventricosus]
MRRGIFNKTRNDSVAIKRSEIETFNIHERESEEKHTEEAKANFSRSDWKPAGGVFPKLSRILPQKGAVSPFPAWLKKFEATVTQNPMTIRFFIIVIEKYLGKESNSKRCVPNFRSYRLKDKLT